MIITLLRLHDPEYFHYFVHPRKLGFVCVEGASYDGQPDPWSSLPSPIVFYRAAEVKFATPVFKGTFGHGQTAAALALFDGPNDVYSATKCADMHKYLGIDRGLLTPDGKFDEARTNAAVRTLVKGLCEDIKAACTAA